MPASHKDATQASLLSRVMYWFNGTNAVAVDATNPMPVQSSAAAPSSVQGNVANNAAEAGNPVLMAGTYDATPAWRTTGNRSRLQTGSNGSLRVQVMQADLNNAVGCDVSGADDKSNTVVALKVSAYGSVQNAAGTWDSQRGNAVGTSVLPGLSTSFWNYAAANLGIVNSAAAVTVKASAGASVRNYISSIDLEWETLGAATEFAIRDGAAGTVIYRTKLGTAAGRKTINFPVPLRGSANTLVEVVTLTASVTGAVYVNLQGFTGA